MCFIGYDSHVEIYLYIDAPDRNVRNLRFEKYLSTTLSYTCIIQKHIRTLYTQSYSRTKPTYTL